MTLKNGDRRKLSRPRLRSYSQQIQVRANQGANFGEASSHNIDDLVRGWAVLQTENGAVSDSVSEEKPRFSNPTDPQSTPETHQNRFQFATRQECYSRCCSSSAPALRLQRGAGAVKQGRIVIKMSCKAHACRSGAKPEISLPHLLSPTHLRKVVNRPVGRRLHCMADHVQRVKESLAGHSKKI